MKWKIQLLFYCLVVNVNAINSLHPQVKSVNDVQFNGKSSDSQPNNSDKCASDLFLFQQALGNKETWAVRFTDTWAKVGAGYLSGNTISIGDFDSCVQFKHEQESGRVFQGQYCLIDISELPNSTINNDKIGIGLKHVANFFRNSGITVTNGFCMPKTCNVEEVIAFLNGNFLLENDLVAQDGFCRKIDSADFGGIQYMAISIFSIFVIAVILSTIYDIIISKSKNSTCNKLLTAFSIYTNGSKLFDMTKIKSPSSINCMHGLRAMSVLWIIIGHQFLDLLPYGNQKDAQHFLEYDVTFGSIIRAHPLAVETFFVMGAILMTWTTLRDCEKQQLNIARMIWKRYIRYTPVFAAIILIVVAFSDMLFQGPFSFDDFKQTCVDNWWYALLHIQNYIPYEKMCIRASWYLSADFQLFIISPFIVWLLHKYGRIMLAIPAALCTATMFYLISISVIYDIEVPSPPEGRSAEYSKYIYYVTHSRAGPWFLGMITGYFLYTYRGRTFKINKFLNAFLWIRSLSTLVAIIFLKTAIEISSDPLPRAVHVSFLTLYRILWSVEICWICFACQNFKTGGFVRWLLSLPQWQPISRMGLSMYLIGPVYQIFLIFNQRGFFYIGFWTIIPIVISDFVIIGMLGTILYLIFEAPPLIIEDYIYKKIKAKNA